MPDAILSIDQGTSNSKAFLFALDGRILTQASRSMRVSYPQPGWAELDPESLWRTVRDTLNEVHGARPDASVRAVAISNQRESILLWDAESGAPIGPCVIWQCRRSSDICARLRDEGREALIAEKSGLGIDPLFPAAKIAWLLDNIPGARAAAEAGRLKAGTVDSWLVWNLTGGKVHATDASNASRTQLMNISTGQWDPELAAVFHVPLNLLPDIRASDADFGTLAPGATDLPEGTAIRAVMGDSHAALYGHGITAPGRIKATLGTGSSLMAVTPSWVRSLHGLSGTIAWSRDSRLNHALEGNISVSGQAAAFATRLLGLPDEAALLELARSVPDSGGVVFVPALAGLGAPHWRDRARGQIVGMSLGTTPAHVARATLEAIALQIRDVFTAMEADLGHELPDISVDGGATANDLLMQLLADLLDRPVIRPAITEVTALGVARMAGEALALWQPDSHEQGDIFYPQMPEPERDQLLARWDAAVSTLKAH